MKKSGLALFFASIFMLGGCTSSGGASTSVGDNIFVENKNTSQLGDFNLLSPTSGDEYIEVPTFTWEASTNATTYTLEVASTAEFITILDTEVYYKKTNISSTSFTIQSALSLRNTTYYWKVTASNGKYEKLCSEVKSFYLAADDKDEVPFDIGEADDWSLHQQGSYADISIDNSNFFGNNKPSLVISFEEENTNQGIPSSDGWMVLTRTIEKDLYGPDSLYLNFYYSGNDANLIIRLVDNDNEYWYSQVQISNNSKQGIILKFSDFIQRTADVTVANREFNYERIKYFEVVFEKAFGDGVCLINDVKGVKFANYENLFIGDLKFTSFTESNIIFENYNFDLDITEKELKMSYLKEANDKNPERGINGYGFTKLITNRYFMTGDAISLEVKYSGTKGSNALIRILEQDNDRWSFKVPFASMTTDEYLKVVIPYEAFAKSSINGDGARQFYYILQLQLGLEGVYGTGSITYKNFSIVKRADVIDASTLIIGEDGVIDNFDDYATNAELSYKWRTSTSNKDEMMNLETTDKPLTANNKKALSMAYKSDMGPATYTIPVDARGLSFNVISFCIKDKSYKNQDYTHLANANAEFALVLTLKSGEEYRYHVDALDSFWYEYVIPFTSFTLANEEENPNPLPITCDGIGYVTFAMQYFYKNAQGKNTPCYTTDNIVLADSLTLLNANEFSKTLTNKVIEPSKSDANIAPIDDFEYASNAKLNSAWTNVLDQSYGKPELSDDVSSSGGNSSMKIPYKGNNASPKVVTDTTVSSACKGKAIVLDLKGDGKATVYINIYLTVGSVTYQYRYTLSSVVDSWNRYSIGFNNFSLQDYSSGTTLSSTNLKYVTKITFGVVNYKDSLDSAIYVDNLEFNANVGYTVNTVVAL